MLLGSSIVFLIFVSIIVFLIRKRQFIKREKRHSIEKFIELTEKRSFTDDEIVQLKQVALYNKIVLLGELVVNREVFNAAVETYITDVVKKLDPVKVQSVFSRLTAIRKKNGFNQPLPFSPITTTKEIPVNTKIIVQLGKKVFRSAVVENVEQYLLVLPQPVIDHDVCHENAPAVYSFFRKPDGHYKIRTRIERLLPEPMQAIGLGHTAKIKEAIKRKHQRANLHSLCKFEIIDKDFFTKGASVEGSTFTGTLLNFSEGGMRLATVQNIDMDSYLKVSFRAGEKYMFENIKGKILKKIKTSKDYVYHVQFIGIGEELYKKLAMSVEYLNRLETIRLKRNKIRPK